MDSSAPDPTVLVQSQDQRVIGSCMSCTLTCCNADESRIHRKGGPLAVTDANLVLGRLVPPYFPKIFGKNADEPLDAQASLQKFEELAKEINATYEKKLGLDEIVYGSVRITLSG